MNVQKEVAHSQSLRSQVHGPSRPQKLKYTGSEVAAVSPSLIENYGAAGGLLRKVPAENRAIGSGVQGSLAGISELLSFGVIVRGPVGTLGRRG